MSTKPKTPLGVEAQNYNNARGDAFDSDQEVEVNDEVRY